MEHINVNLVPGGVPSICHASQYDEGRIIRAHLLDGILPHTLSGTETISLSMRKPDLSRHVYTLENSSSDYIDIVTTSDMCSVAGESECKFIITDSSNITGTANFKMKIESDAYGDSLVVKSVSGPIATFETDIAENLIKLDVDLEPVQDLHGYDGAWRAGIINQITVNRTKGDAGAYGPNVTRDWDYTKYYVGFSYNNYYAENMLTSYNVGNDIVSVTQSRNAYGIAFPIRAKPNHQYYIGCTFGGTVRLAASYFDNTGSLITYVYNIEANRIITTPDNCSTLVLVVYDGAASGVSVSASNIFINDPATETSYIPYSNICPISGHDSAQLIRTGKNWFDISDCNGSSAGLTWETNGNTITWGGTATTSGWKSIKTFTLPVGTYHFHLEGDGYWLERFASKGKDAIITVTDETTVYRLVMVATTAGQSYSGTITNIQIESGSTATPYEPYTSDPTPITVHFGQTVYEGHLDSTNRKVLVTKKGVKIKDLTWSYVSSFTYFSATVNDILLNTNAGHVLDGLMCEVYTNRTPTQAGSGNVNGSIAGFNNTLRIKDLAYDNKDDLIDAVGDYLIVYPLAEPFYVDLSQDKIGIPALVGENNVYSDAGDVTVEYYAIEES